MRSLSPHPECGQTGDSRRWFIRSPIRLVLAYTPAWKRQTLEGGGGAGNCSVPPRPLSCSSGRELSLLIKGTILKHSPHRGPEPWTSQRR